MRKEQVEIHEKARRAHQEIYELVSRERGPLTRCSDLSELADAVYALDRAEKFLDDARREAKKLREDLERVACLHWASTDGEPIRTAHVTASPHIQPMPQVPSHKKEPEKYAQFMDSLGVPAHLRESDLVRPHWPGLKDHVARLMEEGRPMPAGVDPESTYSVFSLRLRPKKEILPSDHAG